jgi:hypothetical protein
MTIDNTMPLRERAARRVCEMRGQDPDALVAALNNVPHWEFVAINVIGPALNREACEAIAWAKKEEAGEPEVIDLDQLFLMLLREAVGQQTWMPPEYTANDWQADILDYVRNGPSAFTGETP